jgi:type II secretory pathway pseudopilin PulG
MLGRMMMVVALLLSMNALRVDSATLSLRRTQTQQLQQQQQSRQVHQQQQQQRQGSSSSSSSSFSGHGGYHDEITCRLSLYEFIDSQDHPNQKRPAYMCSPVLPNGKVGDREYEVSAVDDSLRAEHRQTMDDGLETFVTITKCVVNEETAHVRLTDGSQISLSSVYHRKRRRKLAVAEGTLKALVVRIVMNDKQPMYSRDDLYRITFQESVSLRNQYSACSSGKLRVEPSSLGAIEVRVNQYSSQSSNKQAVNEATTAALAHVNSQTGQSYTSLMDYVDMVLFVTPELGDFLAYASVGGGQSVYNDKWGGYVASQMHETGYVPVVQQRADVTFETIRLCTHLSFQPQPHAPSRVGGGGVPRLHGVHGRRRCGVPRQGRLPVHVLQRRELLEPGVARRPQDRGRPVQPVPRQARRLCRLRQDHRRAGVRAHQGREHLHPLQPRQGDQRRHLRVQGQRHPVPRDVDGVVPVRVVALPRQDALPEDVPTGTASFEHTVERSDDEDALHF